MEEFKPMRVITSSGKTVTFLGKYRRDLEKSHWHYYETSKGDILHFRKDAMDAVLEGSSTTVSVNR